MMFANIDTNAGPSQDFFRFLDLSAERLEFFHLSDKDRISEGVFFAASCTGDGFLPVELEN